MGLRVTLAGEVGLELGETRVEAGNLGRLGRVAFAYLVSERARPVPRDELADALWGEALPRSWETSVRVVVSRLRTWVGAAGLDGGEALSSAFGCYQIRLPAGTVVDIEQAEGALQSAQAALLAGDAKEARRCAKGASAIAGRDFLPGGSGTWVERRQAELRDLRLAALEALSDACLADGAASDAVAAAEEAVGLDPLRETAYVRVMAGRAAEGNRSAALRAYERCRQLLAEALGISPSPATESAYLALLADESPGPSAIAAPGQREILVAAGSGVPATLSSFVGRQDAVAEVSELVRTHRLVTLAGTGGIGKTRLALEAARGLASGFPDGAVFLALAADTDDPEAIPGDLLRTLGLAEEGGLSPINTLCRSLAHRNLLLVLDNCEHVVADAADLVAALLAASPGLTVLATSREALGVPGETVWRVPPLTVEEASRLFVERARGLQPTWSPEPSDEETLAAICRRLDGIPLAVELASARTTVLSLPEIASRLDDRFRLLTGGERTAPSRHQTLRAAIDWTYQSLPESEQRLLQRLAVFAGTFSLDAAERVGSGDGIAGPEVIDLLTALVRRSLVLAHATPGAPARFRLLETIRSYATEKLELSGEAGTARSRLQTWAAEWAQEAEARLDGPDQAVWLDRLELDHPNFRSALAADRTSLEALRLAASLGRFWEMRGHFEEGRRQLRNVLDVAAGAPSLLRARAQNAAGVLAQHQGDYPAARSRYEESLALRRRLEDRLGAAMALHGLGNVAALEHDHAAAKSLYEQSLAIGRELGEPSLVAAALANLGWVAHAGGDFPTAQAYYDDALTVRRALGDKHGIALLLGHLGDLAFQRGDYAAAGTRHGQSLDLRTELGDRAGQADSLATLGHLAMEQAHLTAARAHLERSLALRQELGDRAALPGALCNLADLALLAGDLGQAQAALDEAEAVAAEGRDHPALAHVLLHQGRLARATGSLSLAAEHYANAHKEAGLLGRDAWTAEWLEGVAATAAAGGDPGAGARLLGAADDLRREIGAPVPPHERGVHASDLA
ncbi:MAG: tetratricopeptide repeat protein, partial [Actinobacteria bacterium]|nr:tetratricopeptide repeat protein [Actinomycetota bacterium]